MSREEMSDKKPAKVISCTFRKGLMPGMCKELIKSNIQKAKLMINKQVMNRIDRPQKKKHTSH